MTLEPGKLYKINEYFWFLFPSLETGTAAARAGAFAATSWASYWSNKLNCIVSFLNEGDVVMIVEVSGEQVKVINHKGESGWMNFPATEKWTEGMIAEISSNEP